MNPIPNISVPSGTAAQPPDVGTVPKTEAGFKDFLLSSLRHVNSMQQEADRAVEQLMTGGDVSPAEVLTAVQKADMTFRLLLQIRNKLVQAYQEIKEIRI